MGLESLNILFLMINATGILPVRMILDKNKKFIRFDKNWRHPVSWWFVFVVAMQLVHIPTQLVYSITISLGNVNHTTVHRVVMLVWETSYTLVKCVPLILLFYTGNLKKSFQVLSKADRLLDKSSPHILCSSRKRTILGVILLMIGVN